MSSIPMLQLTNVTKRYGNFTAVHSLNFRVEPGEIYGFLGPNGAGKTTTIKMIGGILKPTNGRIFIKGIDLLKNPVDAKRIVGYIPDRPFLYEKLTVREFLEFIGNIYRMNPRKVRNRIEELLHFFGIYEWKDEIIQSFSHGMKQRLVFVSALLPEPELFVVDEPMVGLDPKAAKRVKEVFKNLKEQGLAVFLSTHTLEIAEELCTRIAIIDHGRIIAEGSMEELRRAVQEEKGGLEDIFMKLTGGFEMQDILRELRMT